MLDPTRPGPVPERRIARSWVRRLLTPGLPANRLLRFALLLVGLIPTLHAFQVLLLQLPFGVDLEIPLRAAGRWVDGGLVYDPASFEVASGPGLPYLYPPFLLPILAPLLLLPRAFVLPAWVLVCIIASVWALRRLRAPWLVVPVLLIWPPFAEGWITGNIQIVLFALFISLFVAPGAGAVPFDYAARDPGAAGESRLRRGLEATIIAAFKIAQVHAWLALFRRRPTGALLGVVVVGFVVLATVPLTGLEQWSEWLAQIRRATDPAWPASGIGLSRYLGSTIGLGVAVASIIAVLLVPRREVGASVGVLAVVGAMLLRTYGLLFLLPAGLRLRRELGLLAFALIGTFTEPGIWAGIALVATSWLLALRSPALLEPPAAGRTDISGHIAPDPRSVPPTGPEGRTLYTVSS